VEQEDAMSDEMNRHLDSWLRDAHAMEEQAEQMLQAMAGRIENYPELAAGIERHLAETRSQRDRLRTCLDRRGVSSSGMKDLAGKFTAMMQGLSGTVMPDEVVKGVLASYTFEHFELGSYRLLIAGARAVGDQETARVCEEIAQEEEAMANMLSNQMPQIVSTFLQRSAAEMSEAKR
jgi:ferritin-like metal-binding protein YciE